MARKDIPPTNGGANGHDPQGRFTAGNSGGKKGRSGNYPAAIAIKCEHLITTEVLPTIEKYLIKHRDSPKACADKGYQWCAQYLANLLPKEIQHTGEVDLNVQDASLAFQGRMDRLTARLGTAGMPEWPER